MLFLVPQKGALCKMSHERTEQDIPMVADKLGKEMNSKVLKHKALLKYLWYERQWTWFTMLLLLKIIS